jgi:hypothetical protein
MQQLIIRADSVDEFLSVLSARKLKVTCGCPSDHVCSGECRREGCPDEYEDNDN